MDLAGPLVEATTHLPLFSSVGLRNFLVYSPRRVVLPYGSTSHTKAHAYCNPPREWPMPAPTCPKCNGEHVRAVTIWPVTPGTDDVAKSPQPVWACQALSCRHQWARQADAEATRLQTKWKSEGDKPCAHPIQNLLDLSPGRTGPVMGLYYCGECGKEIVRPYKRW